METQLWYAICYSWGGITLQAPDQKVEFRAIVGTNMLMDTRKFFATVVVLLLVCQLDISAQGRLIVLGGRAKRTQGGGVKQNVSGLTGSRHRTLVN